MSLTREDYVTKSVTKYLKDILATRGYTDDTVELLDSFPQTGLESPLSKTFIAAGFNFDDGGKQAELGSTLKFRLYTIEFFIFGNTRTWAKNVANAVKFSLEQDQIVPIFNILDPAMPQMDAMPVINCSAEHQPIPKPAPWEENVWTVHLRVEDTYIAADAVA
jgi:hypothetical protein